MADTPPARILATPASDTYFGPGVINFLNQVNRSALPIIVATPQDYSGIKPTQQFAALLSSSGAVSERVQQDIAVDLRTGYSIAYRTTATPPTGITVLAEPGSSPQQIFNSFAGLPPNTPNNAPGSVTDWRSLLLFHEQGHHNTGNAQLGRDRKDAGGPNDELHAEHDGTDIYRQALQVGVVRDPKVPEALSAARLLQAVIRPAADKDYAAASLVNTPLRDNMAQPGSAGSQAALESQVGIDRFKRAVYAEAIRMENPQKYDLIRAQAMYDDLAANPGANPMKEALKELLDQVKKGKRGAVNDIREFISQFPNDTGSVTQRIHQACIEHMGMNMDETNRNSPYTQHLLNAAVALRDRNGFADDPVTHTVMNSFITSARTYVPGYFKDNSSSAPASKIGAVLHENGQQQMLTAYQDLMARPTVAQVNSQDRTAPPAMAASPNDTQPKIAIKTPGQV